jgi:hypothetical protein
MSLVNMYESMIKMKYNKLTAGQFFRFDWYFFSGMSSVVIY